MSAEIFKILLIGPPNVGKSSLVKRFTADEFEDSYIATAGVSLSISRMDFPEGRIVLTLLDLGGQESYRDLRNRFYQGAHYVILVYDRTDRSTFQQIPKWYESFCRNVCVPQSIFVPGALVANKVDLSEKEEVSSEEGKQLANILAWDYFETSAVTGVNVSELFIKAAYSSRRQRCNPPLESDPYVEKDLS
ncbi:MAG: Rab family GTPase [Candidatus Thorarchaeota archaeon]|jgi:small GTP-binding protein